MVSLAFYGFSFLLWNFPYMGKNCKNSCNKLFAISSFALLPSNRFNLHVYFRLICQISIIEMPSLNRNEKVTCENFCTQATKPNLARRKKKSSVGTLFCSQCPKFSTKSQNDLNYHSAKKQSVQKADAIFKCEL